MTWDLIQNIAIVLLVLWNLSIVRDANRALRVVSGQMGVLRRRTRRQ